MMPQQFDLLKASAITQIQDDLESAVEADRILAETAATTATTQADISTTQAGISTTQAGIAADSAASAQASAIAAGAPIFADTTAGLAGTVSGEFFYVPEFGGLRAYENDAGTAVAGPFVGQPVFALRVTLIAAIAAGYDPVDGTVVTAGGVMFEKVAGSADVLGGLPGWREFGALTPQHCGSLGILKSENPAVPWLLSDFYDTLASAQAIYPKATTLDHTVDDMAFQRMVDVLRGETYRATGGQEMERGIGSTVGQVTRYVFPRGRYYLTRPVDMTDIRTGHSFWNLHSEGAVIMGCTPGKPIFDLVRSRKCLLTGVCNIVGVWTEAGVSRSGIQFGRGVATEAADSHTHTGGWEIAGRFSLAAIHNYASENVRFGAMSGKNVLDHRVHHCDFADSDDTLVFLNGEPVTWGSGSGTVAYARNDTASGQVAIKVETGSPPGNSTVITGGTSEKVATISGDPRQEPMGEGPGGRSYVLVQDGDNYWDMKSDYRAVPPKDTPGSFLRNVGTVDLRHTGRGDASWFSRPQNHDYTNSYFVCTDNEGGAAVVGFANTSDDVLLGCTFDSHIESDMGDLDPNTGLQHTFKFAAASTRDLTLDHFRFVVNNVHSTFGVFRATSSVSNVKITASEIEIEAVRRDVGKVLFSPTAKFSFYGGSIKVSAPGVAPFVNISNMADIGGSIVTVHDVAAANVRHPTGSYVLMDMDGRMQLRNLRDLTVSGVLGYRAQAGTGGTVTQETSKATPVTINKRTGLITLNNESLAAGATAMFEVNNSEVTSADIVHVGVASASTSYRAECRSFSNGRFAVAVTNTTGSDLAQQLSVRFMILRSSNN